jgi:hypothetical protein
MPMMDGQPLVLAKMSIKNKHSEQKPMQETKGFLAIRN